MGSTTSTTNSSSLRRWGVLFSMGLTVFGVYYLYDAISPMKNALEVELGISPTDFGWLVSFYAVPNVLGITLFGGLLMDKRGIRFAGLLFASLAVIGGLLTAIGASSWFPQTQLAELLDGRVLGWSSSLTVMVLGRFIFGLGGEVLIVAQNKIISRWFRGEELALAFGINLVVCRLGTISAISFTSLILGSTATWTMVHQSPHTLPSLIPGYPGYATALWTAAFIMLVSFGAFFVYLFLDKDRGRPSAVREKSLPQGTLGELFTNRPFVYINLLNLVFYSAIFPFLSFATDILINKYSLSVERAGLYTSTVTWTTIVFTPLFGTLVDRLGRRASFMVAGSLLLTAAHGLLGFTALPPLVPMALLGLSFSIVPAALWPSVPMLVAEQRLGAAYGFMAQVQSLGLWLLPLLMGWILSATNPGVSASLVARGLTAWDYRAVMVILMGLGLLGLLFSWLLLKGEHGAHATGLERPSGEPPL